MEAKRLVSEALVKKLAHGHLASKLEAASEIRLFAKWDDSNRASLAHAGAIPLLLHYCSAAANTDVDSAESVASLQEKSLSALYNLSLHPSNKFIIASSSSASLLPPLLTSSSPSPSSSSSDPLLSSLAASVLLSLMQLPLPRSAVLRLPRLAPSLLFLLRHGGSKAKGEALRTLFQAISNAGNRSAQSDRNPGGGRFHQDTGGDTNPRFDNIEELEMAPCVRAFKEDLLKEGMVPLLLTLTACGRPRLTEDCLALLTELIKGFPRGAGAVLAAPAAMDLILRAMESEETETEGCGGGGIGSARQPKAGRARENATALMLELWQSGMCEGAAVAARAAPRAMAAAARVMSGAVAATERGRRKAEALAEVLGSRMGTLPDSLPERQHLHWGGMSGGMIRFPSDEEAAAEAREVEERAYVSVGGYSGGGASSSPSSGGEQRRRRARYLARAFNSLMPKRYAAKWQGSA